MCASASSPKILVVDDEAFITLFLSEALKRRLEAQVTTCSDGQQAIAAIQADDFHLIISDIRMPILDGVALFEWIKQHRPHLQRRFFFITGDEGALEAIDVIQNRQIPVLRKPFLIDELVQITHSVLKIQPEEPETKA